MASPNSREGDRTGLVPFGLSVSRALEAAGVLDPKFPAGERAEAVVRWTNSDWLERRFGERDPAAFTRVGAFVSDVSAAIGLKPGQGRLLRDLTLVDLDLDHHGNPEAVIGLDLDWRQRGIGQDVAGRLRERVERLEAHKARKPRMLPTDPLIEDLAAVEKARISAFQDSMMRNSPSQTQRRVQHR